MAVEKIRKVLGEEIPIENFLIIGDTPKDMDCGHVNGIPGVAVATGIFK